MTIYPEDKETLLNGTSLVRFKIEILKDGKIVKTLDENSIVDLDLEDFRYVDSDSLVVGQFVAKKVTGELDKVYDEFSIEDTEIALRMGLSYNNDNRFETRNIGSIGGNAVTCTDQTAIPTPTKPVPFKPLHGKIPLYINWSGKDNDVTLDEIDLGDITLELFSMNTRLGMARYYLDTIRYNHLNQQWQLKKCWASITGADILNTYNSSTNPSQFIKYDTDSKTIYIKLVSVVHHDWELSNYTNITYANRVRSNYFPSAHYAETPDSEENIQGVDKALQDNNIYITIRYDSLFTDVDSFIAWLKEHQDLEIKYYMGNKILEITEEDYPELYKQLQQILVSGTTYYYLGKYLVTKPTTDDVKSKTTFEALDYTKKFNKKFDPSGITFPCTAFELADYCCKKCGVYLDADTFTNADFEIKNNQYDSDATYRNVMQDIGKLAYSWVRINDNNDCVIDFNVPTEDDFNEFNKITGSNYYDLSRKEKAYGPVNRVVIGLSDIEGENVTVEDTDSINKNGVCELKVMDNNLTYTPELRAKASEGAKRLFGLTYFPLEITTTGHPWLEGNDLIEITTPDGNTFTTLPFDRTLTYAGHIKTKITSKGDTALETAYKSTPSMESEIKRTRYIVDKDGQRITELVEKSTKQDQQISELTVSVDNIESKVSQISDLTREVTSDGKLLITNSQSGYLLGFKIYGDIMLPLFPRNNLYPSDTLFPKSSDYVMAIKYQENGEDRTKEIKLPFDYLLVKDDIYDEFVIDSDGNCYTIRRLQILDDGTIDKLEQEVRIDYDNLKIPVYEGDNEYSIISYNPTIYAKYVVKSDLTDTFATKVEVNSKILQTRDQIELSVTKTISDETNTNALISKINLSPGQIALEGTVTTNGNFKVLKDGSIEATNGTFSGNIFLPQGGKVIGGNGLLTNLQFSSYGKYNGYDWNGVFAYDEWSGGTSQIRRILCDIPVDIYIPDNFTVVSIKLSYYHIPIYWNYYNNKTGASSDFWGSAKQLKLYNGENTGYNFNMGATEYSIYPADIYANPMRNAFGSDSYTPTNTSGTTPTEKTTIELTGLDSFESGHYCLVVRTALQYSSLGVEDCLRSCGMGKAIVNIIGYSSY